jgi:hypothetical protein
MSDKVQECDLLFIHRALLVQYNVLHEIDADRRNERNHNGRDWRGAMAMIGPLVENLIGAFLSQRRSVRRLIDGGHGMDAALLMVLLGYVTREIFILITPDTRLEGGGVPLAQYIMGLIEAYLTFGLMTALVLHVGRLFGGSGTLRGAALTVAWYLLVISILTPMVVPAFLEFAEAAKAAADSPDGPVVVPGGAMLLLTISSCLMLWLLAAYIAELHRFARTWNVLFVVIGLSIPISILASSLMPLA